MLNLIYIHLIFSFLLNPLDKKPLNTAVVDIEVVDINRYFVYNSFNEFQMLDSVRSNLEFDNLIELWDAKNSISFYLYPNDHIKITNNKNDDYPILSSGNYLRDKEFTFQIEFHKRFGTSEILESKAYLTDEYKIDTQRRDQALNSELNKKLQFIDNYCYMNDLSEEFIKLFKANILFWHFSNLLAAGMYDFDHNYSKANLQKFKDEIFHIKYIETEAYKMVNRAFLIVSKKIEPEILGIDIIKSLKSLDQQNFAFAQTLYQLNKGNEFYSTMRNEKNSFWENLKQSDHSNKYVIYLQNIYDSQQLEKETIVSFDLIKTSFKEKLKTKLTYIDFWASWCGPCIQEIVPFKKLEEEYEHSSLGFISISVDENVNNWLTAGKKYGFNKENSFYVGTNTFTIIEDYEIKTLPRYMIVDNNGNVVNADAPRPSSLEIRIVLDSLLRTLK